MKRALLALAVVSIVLGCGGNPEKQVVGRWKADTAATTLNGKDDALGKQLLNEMSLEIREDKTFTMSFFMTFDGNWSIQEGMLVLQPKSAQGTDAKLPKFKIEGDRLTSTSADQTLVLVRAN